MKPGLWDTKRPGSAVEITDEAKAWVIKLACAKPKDHGLAAETWTFSRFTKYIKSRAAESGYDCLFNVARSKIHSILKNAGIKLGKVCYYCERRDLEFEAKMTQILTGRLMTPAVTLLEEV